METNEKIVSLVEDTTGPNAPEIETTDENLITADQMFHQAALPSLGRQIFNVIEINGPTGAIFNTKKKAGSDEFELVRKDVEVFPSESISTGISQEAIEDIKTRFGRKARNIIGTLLRGLANDQENTRTLAFLEAESAAVADLNLSNSLNAESNLFEITQAVHELVLKINSKNMRSYEAFAVIPYAPLGGVMGLTQYGGGAESAGKNEKGLYIGQVGRTKFFMNPDATSTKAYVGIKDTSNPSKSSAIFSPYMSTVTEATNPDTGQINFFIFNRFAITASPLHETGNEMLYKFNIIV